MEPAAREDHDHDDDDGVALVLALAAATTPDEMRAARLAAIRSGDLGHTAGDCTRHGHALAIGCPTSRTDLGEWHFLDHGPLTLATRIGAVTRRLIPTLGDPQP